MEQLKQQDNTAVIEIEREAKGLTGHLAALFPDAEIITEDDLVRASNALTQITRNKLEWEKRRKALVKPANDWVKWVNDQWKGFIGPVEQAEARIRTMMSAFRAKEQQRRQAEYTAALEESKEIFPGGSPIPEVVAPIPQESLRRVETDNGSVGFTTVWKWTITDIGQIPTEYWALDETKITKVVKAGIREIPGIRIYAEEVPTVRRS